MHAEELLLGAEVVDGLDGFTVQMWDILTDVVLFEWFQLRLPSGRVPWGGPVVLPPQLRLLYSLDRHTARVMRSRIEARYLSRPPDPGRISIFTGYGLTIPDDFQRERDGLTFLARQAEHFRSDDDWLFATQCLAAGL